MRLIRPALAFVFVATSVACAHRTPLTPAAPRTPKPSVVPCTLDLR